ncbi:hypothetical protein DI272_19000 [Streptomyces sp. Act143]|uniref:hypothetical protein n=1 Tax=Streptomyces sp. Act143 TaxID=2200760 RepID=UPI000D677B0C|nr:hypothetical protein [Streptomyces sp. Act143]PWI16022.1 hypothetical protein DI272_19000 [Streptomyces sp. Act143]
MTRIVLIAVYLVFLCLGLSAAPPGLLHTFLLNVATVGLVCMVVLQLRSTKNALDYALARGALGAAVVVVGLPFALPVLHVLVGGAR